VFVDEEAGRNAIGETVSDTQIISPIERIHRRKKALQDIRDRARTLFDEGARGLQIASWLSEAIDGFTVTILEETLAEFPETDRAAIARNSAMIAVGGSGRGELAPYSDADLIFVFRPQITDEFSRFSKRFVPEYWDAGVKLGQRIMTVQDVIRNALIDPHLASSLIHIRCLWGDDSIAASLEGRFKRRVVRARRRAFIDDCVAGRVEEREQAGATGQQLEPDVKRALGGLRDVHLLQWVAYAYYSTGNIDALRRQEALSRDDAARLMSAIEFLTRIRIDMHLHQNRAHDILSKDEQLRIAETMKFEHSEAQRPVELFMQEYFRHATAVADISKRFVARHRSQSMMSWLQQATISHRVNEHFVLRPNELDASPSLIPRVCTTLDDIVRIYHSAAFYRVGLSPRLTDAVKQTARNLPSGPSPEAARLFLEILATNGNMASTLRSMHDTNVLELIIPEWQRVRCLMQFNQYHHFTVDEHTLKCLEICEQFEQEDTPRGSAYRNIKSRELLHLALLLHDAGKGYEEPHSEVGRRLAIDVCQRFRMSDRQTEVVSFLIHQHLVMADLAFRQDTADPRILLDFSRELGSPDRLRMLYVLTAADVNGVGPDVWNNWKADLLSGFYDRLMLILSGQPPRHHEAERLSRIRETVYRSIVPLEIGESSETDGDDLRSWIDQQLEAFSPQYLMTTPPARIAADLDIVRCLQPGEIRVDGHYNKESETVDYRIITDAAHSGGCFHLISGVLAARHMEILGAEITTTIDNTVVDVFHVIDPNFAGEVPPHRIEEVSRSIHEVLNGNLTVEELFCRHKRFTPAGTQGIVADLPLRVEVDDETSDRCTVISVFAHDQPGLLYTITRTLYQLGLSIELAKIATHFDQVADIFYVTDNDGRSIESAEQQRAIQNRLMSELEAFEASNHRAFV
jgi:[protein-PII] uridylyltransferase